MGMNPSQRWCSLSLPWKIFPKESTDLNLFVLRCVSPQSLPSSCCRVLTLADGKIITPPHSRPRARNHTVPLGCSNQSVPGVKQSHSCHY